jgi:hypothetical protein
MRQRSGEYDPEELALIRESGGGNTIFMMIAATKCNAAASRRIFIRLWYDI